QWSFLRAILLLSRVVQRLGCDLEKGVRRSRADLRRGVMKGLQKARHRRPGPGTETAQGSRESRACRSPLTLELCDQHLNDTVRIRHPGPRPGPVYTRGNRQGARIDVGCKDISHTRPIGFSVSLQLAKAVPCAVSNEWSGVGEGSSERGDCGNRIEMKRAQ